MMRSMQRRAAVLALAAAAVAGPALADHHGAKPNIVGVAAGNADFSTLVTAVKAADLVGTLSGAGPFTVFAPTNAAFGKLPAGTVETLVKPENKATLTKILTCHVVAGKVEAKTLLGAIQANAATRSTPSAAAPSRPPSKAARWSSPTRRAARALSPPPTSAPATA